MDESDCRVNVIKRRMAPRFSTRKSLWRMNSFSRLRLPPLTRLRARTPANVPGVPNHPDATWGDSVCKRLEYIDLGNSVINDPVPVASFISLFFPNVRSVTDVCHYSRDFAKLEEVNQALAKQGARRWEAIDKLMSTTPTPHRGFNPLLRILPGPGTSLIEVH